MSFIVHPAPRITRAPVPNNARFQRQAPTGIADEYAAIVIDHAVKPNTVQYKVIKVGKVRSSPQGQ